MKNRYLLCVSLMAILTGSCQREEPDQEKPGGFLKINIGLFIHVNEVNSNLKSTFAAEDFKVTIFNADGSAVRVFAKASELPAEVELDIGEYYVAAHSDNNLPAAFENPYYYGESERFTINAGTTQSVTVNCELANAMISVIYSDNVRSTFVNYSTTVSSSEGSLTFVKDEIRAGFFQPLPLSISATLTFEKPDGSLENKILTGTIPAPQPKKHYEIHVDASAASGAAGISIILDENTDPVEIVQITDNNTTPVAGDIQQGDLLITEIMYDPTALSDTEGEWLELFNNTNHAIDLNNLVIRKNDTEYHIIEGPLILGAYGYIVLARASNATAGSNYLYNTDITLNNTGAILSLCNFGTDGTNGTVISSVNYGADGFPDATGASICLDPDKLSLAEMMLGESWCSSATAYNTGDLGTPGSVNDNCN